MCGTSCERCACPPETSDKSLSQNESLVWADGVHVRSAIRALTGGGVASIPLGKRKLRKNVAKKRRGGRKMSAAARKAVSKRMKAYWAKRKAKRGK